MPASYDRMSDCRRKDELILSRKAEVKQPLTGTVAPMGVVSYVVDTHKLSSEQQQIIHDIRVAFCSYRLGVGRVVLCGFLEQTQ